MDDGVIFQRLVGVSHYQAALERCSAGQPVRIIHEPDNPHDAMALRVDSLAGETIGYLPRRSPVHIAIHQDGRGASAVIDSLGWSRSCLLGATLSMAICDDVITIASHFQNRSPPEPPRGGFRYWVKDPADVARLAAGRR